MDIPETMRGAFLPGNSSVELKYRDVPEPGNKQVLVQIKASSICGSDIRAIYREHKGKGPEAYQGVIAGHEPSGLIVKTGPGCSERQVGDRVCVYHISGCGCCKSCMSGYQISCSSPGRAAYGWQRDGGHAPFMLAEEQDCIALAQNLTFIDGAFMACGYGTAWECLNRMKVCGSDRLLITGLGPVGLAAAQLGKALGAAEVIGVEINSRRRAFAKKLLYETSPLIDHLVAYNESADRAIRDITNNTGCEVSIDCSGSPQARLLALQNTARWGRCGFVGEGGSVNFSVSESLIHKQITLYGSWVTSKGHMYDLGRFLSANDLHPQDTRGPEFSLAQASQAYKTADNGDCGKVTIVF